MVGQQIHRFGFHNNTVGISLKKRISVLVLAMSAVVTIPAGTARSEPFPSFSGAEWTNLVVTGLGYLPGLAAPTGTLPITGNSTLDARIWSIAFSRGYRLRPTADPTALVVQDGFKMQPAAAKAWEALQSEASSKGVPVVIQSAYRSITDQRSIFNQKLTGTSDLAIDQVLRYSAPPGASLHHTGYALDIKTPGSTIGAFSSTAAFKWLSANNYEAAKRHGFVPSYPSDAPSQGPVPEPWEYTYVGVEAIRCKTLSPTPDHPLARCPTLAVSLEGAFTTPGQSDLAVFDGRTGTWEVNRSVGTGFVAENWDDFVTASGWLARMAGDFNGDGKDDIAQYHPSNGTWWISKSTGSSFATGLWADFSTASGWTERMVGDFNGDGKDDIAQYHPSNGTWWISKSTGSSFATGLWADFSTATGWQARMVGDFNGDGKDDIAQYHPSNGTWWISKSTGTGFVTELWADFSTASGWIERMVGDFNGDGKDDIAQYHPSNGTWWISKSTGSSFSTGLWADFSTVSGWEARMVGDFNGDGKDDIAQYHSSNGTWWISRSTGSTFTTGLWADFSTTKGWANRLVGDFNGDGKDDIAQFHPSNATWWVSRSDGTGLITIRWSN